MTGTTADSVRYRDFSAPERADLRRRRVDEDIARRYPSHLSVVGIADLVDAGVAPERIIDAPRGHSARALIAFLRRGADLDDIDYDERFVDASFLADHGIPASVANAFPAHLSELDVARLDEAGVTAIDAEAFGLWTPADIATLTAARVRLSQAIPYRSIEGVPTEVIPECVRARVDPALLDRWLRVVGPSVRTDPGTLVRTALCSRRLDDPEGFRSDLLQLAVRSMRSSPSPRADIEALIEALTAVLAAGGELATTIPSAWSRERTLFVGPSDDEVAIVSTSPEGPLTFTYGEVEVADGIGAIRSYAGRLVRRLA